MRVGSEGNKEEGKIKERNGEEEEGEEEAHGGADPPESDLSICKVVLK